MLYLSTRRTDDQDPVIKNGHLAETTHIISEIAIDIYSGSTCSFLSPGYQFMQQ